MNKAMLTVGIIILSMIGFLLINLISNASTSSELDYYLVKETTEAAMIDAVDITYAREHNSTLRIDKEKFIESFLRRFAASVDNTRDYKIGFYDINEVPPKVSIKVDSTTSISFQGDPVPISTSLDAVLETKYKGDQWTVNEIEKLKKKQEGKGI